jgi:hypothetical protein
MLFNRLFTPRTEVSGANPPPAVQGRKAEMKMHTRSGCYLIGCSPPTTSSAQPTDLIVLIQEISQRGKGINIGDSVPSRRDECRCHDCYYQSLIPVG